MFKLRNIAGCLLLGSAITGGIFLSHNAKAQDKPDQKPDEKAMMEAWQKAMALGKEHEQLAKMVGKWDVEMIDYSMGGANKTQSTAEIKMIMGGRYQELKIKGSMMGQPFEGCSTTAYDNVRKMYENTWIDNMGTSITTAEGKAIDEQTVEMKGKMVDPMSGNMTDFRNVEKHIDDDHFTFDMYMTMHGQEQKAVTATYTRSK